MRALAVLSLALLGGCVKASYTQDLARRATFDLGCPVAATDVTELGANQFGVNACGCRATYLALSNTSPVSFAMNAASGESCSVTAGGESQ